MVRLAQKAQPLHPADQSMGAVAEPQYIGVYALRGSKGLHAYCEAARQGRRTALQAAACVGQQFQFARLTEVMRVLELPERDLTTTSPPIVLVPCTHDAHLDGEFVVHVSSSIPVELVAAAPLTPSDGDGDGDGGDTILSTITHTG